MKSMKRIISGIISATVLFARSLSTVEAKEPLYQEEIPELYTVTEDRIDELTNAIDYEQEYLRAKAGMSDIPITKEIMDSCEASITDINGNKQILETYATVKKLGQVQRSDRLNNVYSLTVFSTTKTDSGTAQRWNTTAYGTVTWIDNWGTTNEMVSAAGGWTPGYGDELTNRVVQYGAMTDKMDISTAWRHPAENSFYYDGNSNMKGLVIFLDSTIDVNGSNLRLRVTSSILT